MKIPELLPGGGEMGKLIRSHNWQETELGAIETWPLPLKTTRNHPEFHFSDVSFLGKRSPLLLQ